MDHGFASCVKSDHVVPCVCMHVCMQAKMRIIASLSDRFYPMPNFADTCLSRPEARMQYLVSICTVHAHGHDICACTCHAMPVYISGWPMDSGSMSIISTYIYIFICGTSRLACITWHHERQKCFGQGNNIIIDWYISHVHIKAMALPPIWLNIMIQPCRPAAESLLA